MPLQDLTSSLPLFVLLIRADHPHHPAAADDLALVTNPLTDALTFIAESSHAKPSPTDPASPQIDGRQARAAPDRRPAPGRNSARPGPPHAPSRGPVVQPHAIERARQLFRHDRPSPSRGPYRHFAGRQNPCPSGRHRHRCSKCADRLLSRVTAVQPSDNTFTAGLPAFTIGSIARTIPSASRGPRPGIAVVRHLRLLVHPLPDAVPDELTHDRKTVGFDVLLNGVADVGHTAAGPHRVDRLVQRLLGDAQQRRRFLRHASHGHRDGAVPVIPSSDAPTSIDTTSPSCSTPLPGRNPVDHFFVDRGADRRRVSVVALERRRCPRRPRSSPRRSRRAPPSMTPGVTRAASAVSTSPTSRPAARIRSSSAAERQTITA